MGRPTAVGLTVLLEELWPDSPSAGAATLNVVGCLLDLGLHRRLCQLRRLGPAA